MVARKPIRWNPTKNNVAHIFQMGLRPSGYFLGGPSHMLDEIDIRARLASVILAA